MAEQFADTMPEEQKLRDQMRDRLEGVGRNDWNSVRWDKTITNDHQRDPQKAVASYFSHHKIDRDTKGFLISKINAVRKWLRTGD